MPHLTIATINVRNRADRWGQRRHLLVSQLLDAAPDLIALQELSFPIGQGRWLRNQINLRLKESGKRPYRLIQKRKRHLIAGYYEGIGILTRLPVLYSDYLALGYGGRLALRAAIELPGQRHLDFVCTHLHHVAHDHEARQEQVITLTGWLHSTRRTPLQVIAGDFNELPQGLAISYMKQSFRSAYEVRHEHEPLATFPTALVRPTPLRDGSGRLGWAGCLDYIFVSPAVKCVKSARIFCDQPAADDETLYPSDHVGLLVELEV